MASTEPTCNVPTTWFATSVVGPGLGTNTATQLNAVELTDTEAPTLRVVGARPGVDGPSEPGAKRPGGLTRVEALAGALFVVRWTLWGVWGTIAYTSQRSSDPGEHFHQLAVAAYFNVGASVLVGIPLTVVFLLGVWRRTHLRAWRYPISACGLILTGDWSVVATLCFMPILAGARLSVKRAHQNSTAEVDKRAGAVVTRALLAALTIVIIILLLGAIPWSVSSRPHSDLDGRVDSALVSHEREVDAIAKLFLNARHQEAQDRWATWNRSAAAAGRVPISTNDMTNRLRSLARAKLAVEGQDSSGTGR